MKRYVLSAGDTPFPAFPIGTRALFLVFWLSA
jgi:hypothetical protein